MNLERVFNVSYFEHMKVTHINLYLKQFVFSNIYLYFASIAISIELVLFKRTRWRHPKVSIQIESNKIVIAFDTISRDRVLRSRRWHYASFLSIVIIAIHDYYRSKIISISIAFNDVLVTIIIGNPMIVLLKILSKILVVHFDRVNR